MQFSERSSDILREFLPHFKKFKLYKKNSNTHNNLEVIFLKLHSNIYNADLQISKNKYVPSVKKITKNSYKQPQMYGGIFFPQEILEYIDSYKKYQLIYKISINDNAYKIIFTLFTDIDDDIINEYNIYVSKIFIILNFFSQLSEKKCGKGLTLFLYPTEFKKRLPMDETKVLGPSEVNTGFTKRCVTNNEIIIYRKEEWLKVLIHELMHAFDLDFISSYKIQNKMRATFNIQSNFLIEETYAEMWARILNCGFCSYFSLKNKRNTSDFLLNMNFTLEIERAYSLFQCGKILHYMNLRINDLIKFDDYHVKFRENSNVFSYYILTCALMNVYPRFLLWCQHNNIKYYKNKENCGNIIKFNKSNIIENKFWNLIFTSFKENKLNHNIQNVVKLFYAADDDIINSLTMTTVEIEI